MKKAKQFLAMLLCLCMVMAVIPANAQQAAAADGDTSVVYNFKYTVSDLADIAADKLDRPNNGSNSDKQAQAMQLVEATSYDLTGRNWHFLTHPEDAWTGAATTWGGRRAFSGNGTNLYLDSTSRWVAFILNIEDAADYNVALNYKKGSCGIGEVYMFPKPADTSADNIAKNYLSSENSLGTFDGYGDTAIEDSAPLKGINVEKAGEYVVVFRGTGKKNAASTADWSFVEGLTLTEKEKESEKLGEHYAYMQKIGDKCVLTVIGGIKDIAGYSEVGFEVTCNGEALTQSSKNVYETITYNGTAIDKAAFGDGISYLFYETFEIDATSIDSLSFRAYGVGADGNEYGATYTKASTSN